MSDFFLPEALIMKIWLRLHIKSTVRFRCVSKSWYASLSDPQFIYKNLTSFNAENEQDLFLVPPGWQSRHSSLISHETLVPSPIQVPDVPSAGHLETGRGMTYSCDDLVCFHDGNEELIGVWNLTTGETKILTTFSNDMPPMFQILGFAFGFDDKIKDYKIVQIGFYKGQNEAYVYSLRTGNNCWRKLDKQIAASIGIGIIEDPWYADAHSYRDGVFYWIVSNVLILSFDMSTEVFTRISIPQPPHPLRIIPRSCKLKDGSMLIIARSGFGAKHFDLWVWLEVGVTPYLTKLFRIDWRCGDEEAFPLGFWGNKLVFQCPSNHRLLIGGDPSNGEPKEVQIDEPLEIVSCLAWTKGKNSIALN